MEETMFHVLGAILLMCVVATVLTFASFAGVGGTLNYFIPLAEMPGSSSLVAFGCLYVAMAIGIGVTVFLWIRCFEKLERRQGIWLLGSIALTIIGIAVVVSLASGAFLLFLEGVPDSCANGRWQDYYSSRGECEAFNIYPFLAITLLLSVLLSIGWYQMMKWSAGQLEKLFPEAT